MKQVASHDTSPIYFSIYACFQDYYDNTYANKLWCIVDQGMFALREINQMEWDMCSYLEWQLNVNPTTLHDFQA
jgi:hypothetical protein